MTAWELPTLRYRASSSASRESSHATRTRIGGRLPVRGVHRNRLRTPSPYRPTSPRVERRPPVPGPSLSSEDRNDRSTQVIDSQCDGRGSQPANFTQSEEANCLPP